MKKKIFGMVATLAIVASLTFDANTLKSSSTFGLNTLIQDVYAGCEITTGKGVVFSCPDDPTLSCSKSKMGYTLTCTKAKSS